LQLIRVQLQLILAQLLVELQLILAGNELDCWLGGFLLLATTDIDRSISGNVNTRWIDQVEVTANGGTLIPGSAPGTSFIAGPAVSIFGNVATGISDSPNAGPNSDFGNVNVDFGVNSISSIEIIYRNAPNATGVDGRIEAQGIALGDISFANPCDEVTKPPTPPTTTPEAASALALLGIGTLAVKTLNRRKQSV
jgi:hypothetical protein